MHTRAVGISPYDLAGGPDLLLRLSRENNLPLLSVNLYPEHGTAPLFRPYLLTRVGSMKVAILGLTGNFTTKQKQREYHLLPWQKTLPPIVEKVEKTADMVILLSSAPRRTNEEIARKFKNINIIFQSAQGNGNQAPVNINNTLICRTASQGKYLGSLRIDWNRAKTWGEDIPDQLKKEQNRLDRINWQIGRMQKRHQARELESNSQFQRLIKEKNKIENGIKQLEHQQNKSKTLCGYKNTFIAIKTSLPEDKAIKAIVDQTRRQVNQINRKVQKERRKKREMQRQPTTKQVFPVPLQEMAGSQACKKCHQAQVAFYLQTDHARAWQTLVDKDQQYNPECLPCHVTLPVYDGKRINDARLLTSIPPQLHNVGCESCHGPARRHMQDPENAQPDKPAEVTCRGCHTKERDKNFIFSEKILKIRCPAG